jgi:hypothetical protein
VLIQRGNDSKGGEPEFQVGQLDVPAKTLDKNERATLFAVRDGPKGSLFTHSIHSEIPNHADKVAEENYFIEFSNCCVY